jgi:hypothetical protein
MFFVIVYLKMAIGKKNQTLQTTKDNLESKLQISENTKTQIE